MTTTDINSYFSAEKNESLLFIIIGIIALGIALYGCFFLKTSEWMGASIPLAGIALIQLTVGGTVYFRSDKDAERVMQQLQQTPEKLKSEEWHRMQSVNKNFNLYKKIEIFLAVTGLFIWVMATRTGNSFWYGLGIALVIQSVLMLVFDFFAEKRADTYTLLIESFINNK